MRILVTEDEKDLADALAKGLKRQGYAVDVAYDGEESLRLAEVNEYDLLVLDLNLPKVDGMEVCKRLRDSGSSIGILMLTARAGFDSRVDGLDVGADDYLVKPFSVMELLARVRAVLRRAQVTETGQDRFFTHENLRIDFARAEVWLGEQPVYLSATEYRLLLQFTHNIGKVLTAEELLTSVWGPEYRDDKEILWVTIARLRQKVEDDPHLPRHIVTRSGLGYLMPPLEG